MQNEKYELRVGIFVTAALALTTIIVFVIGNQSAMFRSTQSYYAVFSAVDGLRTGSPVRIGGLTVGTVDAVHFRNDGQVQVDLHVSDESAAFVRTDSFAAIGSKGLLGDQVVNISVGNDAPITSGSEIPAREESMLAALLGSSGRDAEGIMHNVNEATAGFADPEFQGDLHNIAHNLATVTRMVSENDGTLRRLMTDPSFADDLQATVRSFRTTGEELAHTARGVRQIVGEVRSGNGTAHDVIYGDNGARLLANLADTAGEAATVIRDVRTGNNNAHQLLYGDEAGTLIDNVNQMSGDMRAIVADIRAGRGTIGGFIVDPSIYEDVKRLVGNLERNEILRSLVRYSIREDEARAPVSAPSSAE